jgi:hypothetical protein
MEKWCPADCFEKLIERTLTELTKQAKSSNSAQAAILNADGTGIRRMNILFKATRQQTKAK